MNSETRKEASTPYIVEEADTEDKWCAQPKNNGEKEKESFGTKKMAKRTERHVEHSLGSSQLCFGMGPHETGLPKQSTKMKLDYQTEGVESHVNG